MLATVYYACLAVACELLVYICLDRAADCHISVHMRRLL
jgi:hypothetical protein